MKTIGQRGASAVEFAIILPLLLILIFGVIEFGLIIYDKAMITNAGREGARLGIVFRADTVTGDPLPADAALIAAAVRNYLGINLTSTPPSPCGRLVTFGTCTTPTITATGGATSGSPLTVTVVFSYSFLLLPDLPPAVGQAAMGLTNPLPLNATTVMRME